jgi:transposase
MSGQLVIDLPGYETTALLDVIQDPQREIVSLRQDMADLRRENLQLRQEAGYWKSMHAAAVVRIARLQAEAEQLSGENRQLQARLFGQKSEQSTSRDRSNRLPGEETDGETLPPRSRGQRKGQPGPQRRDYSHLPVVVDSIELPAGNCCCLQCGLPYTPSGSEDSEQVEVDVRPFRRRIRRRRYQRTCRCPGPRTLIAPLPPKLIPKGRLGTSIWVEIFLGKYFSHQPIERQLAAWRLRGLDLAAGTINGGLQRLEPLFRPLYDALLAHSAQADFAQADETRWLVFIEQEGKIGHRWWLWVFLTEDTVVFRLDPSRSHDVPEGHFPADACVILMVDRYSGYKAMAQVKLGNVILVFCWAHVRRDFIEVGKGWSELKPWALIWLRRIRALYRHQAQRLAQQAGSAEFQTADAALRETVAEMQTEAAKELADPHLREPCRKTLTSLKEHWSGLTRFVEDLRIPMDNNASERANRGPALGRKNYYGSGSLWAGRLAAMLFSLFATVTRCGLNPRLWLQWYLESCAAAGGNVPDKVATFLPWNLPPERRELLALDRDDTS